MRIAIGLIPVIIGLLVFSSCSQGTKQNTSATATEADQAQQRVVIPTTQPTETLMSGGKRVIGNIVYIIPNDWCFADLHVENGLEDHQLVSYCQVNDFPRAVLWIMTRGKSPGSSFDDLMQYMYDAMENGYRIISYEFLPQGRIPPNLGENASIVTLTVANPDIGMETNSIFIASFEYQSEYYLVEIHLTEDNIAENYYDYIIEIFLDFLDNVEY